MRVRVLLATLALAGCLARPAFEPVGGFELVDGGDRAAWSELAPSELELWFDQARTRLAALADYSAVLETRERIGDELFPRRVLHLKLRHEPFSVAVETAEPPSEKGQRVWYDASANGGELLAETPGFLGQLVGRLSLDPEGDLAMENRRHPLTDVGLRRLLEQLEERFEPALGQRPRLRSAPASLAGRPARLVEALIPSEPPDAALVHRFGFDGETGLLLYYGQAELLPEGPALVEEYLYRELRANVGLTDADFRPGE